MKFFHEAEPGILVSKGVLTTEQDGRDWVAEYDALLQRERPFAVIVQAGDRPLPPAGKPMILWMKARKAELGRWVRVTIFIIADAAERAGMAASLPGRAKASPYPMALAADEPGAIAQARASLGDAAPDAAAGN
ncbi:hypothetical protein [Bosea sp. (in: a-proteobacteria)]